MTVAVVARDLMITSRIAGAGARAGVNVRRFDDPGQLHSAAGLTLVLVAWDERGPDWGEVLMAWSAGMPETAIPRIILFGSHVDLEAHAAARASGLGPMWARSKLVGSLPRLLA